VDAYVRPNVTSPDNEIMNGLEKDVRASVTIVIPAFNEEDSIDAEIRNLRSVMEKSGWMFDIIVVDDGSTDATAEKASRHDVRLMKLPRNRGYGAALKAGISAAKSEYVIITDADGTYPATAIPALLSKANGYDMIVGARTGENVSESVTRKPAKWFLRKLAGYLAGQPIPDLNSGLRMIKRSAVERFMAILPSGFSFTTTITLAFMCNEYLVAFHPIDYYPRVGKSKIRPVDAYHFLLLILRTVVYFNPLKVFLPLGALFFVVGITKLIYDLAHGNVSDGAVLGFLGALVVWAIGLLSDQISRIGSIQRREN
jgi:glycosyltransferase involved in cell wall biosynthesis